MREICSNSLLETYYLSRELFQVLNEASRNHINFCLVLCASKKTCRFLFLHEKFIFLDSSKDIQNID